MAMYAAFCGGCNLGQKVCKVKNYDKQGKYLTSTTDKCVDKLKACPCGANTRTCTDPLTKVVTCQPKSVGNCGNACTPAEVEVEGATTCVTNNKDLATGKPLPQTVSCSRKGCTPGTGYKTCPLFK